MIKDHTLGATDWTSWRINKTATPATTSTTSDKRLMKYVGGIIYKRNSLTSPWYRYVKPAAASAYKPGFSWISKYRATQKTAAAKPKTYLETSWKWKTQPTGFLSQIFAQSMRMTPAARLAFYRMMATRIKKWTPNITPYLARLDNKNIHVASMLWPREVNQTKLAIERNLPEYIEKVTRTADGMDEGETKATYIARIKGDLSKYAPKGFMTTLSEDIGKPFSETFLAEEMQKNVDLAAFGGMGNASKWIGVAIIGVIGLTLIPKIGGKKRK